MHRRTFLAHSAALLTASALPRAQASVEHVTVWREAGRYGGWPANHGIWSWGDEILVGFTAGVLKTGDPMRHPIDRSAGEAHALARSLDGGRTWTREDPVVLQPPPRPERRAVTGEPLRLPTVQALPGPLDFTAPGLALTFRTSHGATGAWMFVSQDRGRRWAGPYQLPPLDTPGFDPRTDYLVLGPRTLLVFLTAFKTNGKEGRPLAIRTRDGGMTWERLGWIGPETDGFRIMPATVSLGGDGLFTVIRRRDDTRHHLEGYRSRDGGATWTAAGLVAADTGRGNPASLLRLPDGRLCAVYGFRAAPFGMHAVFSGDEGATWSTPRPLREDAADWDLGYPRSVVRADGRVVSAYYFNDASGPERYIAATIWTP
ncbi:sialidase family protein [Luteitalea sp.]|uniref:sialidase family protein n=1 Tax=Luteitalea sp. TaxID=2004800 RepID=UPI0025C07A24|nr:sialidase family protein [Luteitalea sp.]